MTLSEALYGGSEKIRRSIWPESWRVYVREGAMFLAHRAYGEYAGPLVCIIYAPSFEDNYASDWYEIE